MAFIWVEFILFYLSETECSLPTMTERLKVRCQVTPLAWRTAFDVGATGGGTVWLSGTHRMKITHVKTMYVKDICIDNNYKHISSNVLYIKEYFDS